MDTSNLSDTDDTGKEDGQHLDGGSDTEAGDFATAGDSEDGIETDTGIGSDTETDTDIGQSPDDVVDTELDSDSDSDTEADTDSSTEDYPENIDTPGRPQISSINGDGSRRGIVDPSGLVSGMQNARPADSRFRFKWIITGNHLETVTDVRLTPEEQGAQTFTTADGLILEEGGDAMLRSLLLPASLTTGLFTLVLTNEAGSAEAQVFILQGEKGDGLECDDESCTVPGNKDLVVNGNGRFTGEVSAETAVFTTLEAENLPLGESRWAPECPAGYVRDMDVNSFVLCKKNLALEIEDEMVKVADFWIDKYEMSIWPNETCDGVQYLGTTTGWAAERTGIASFSYYGCSLVDVPPSRNFTWFQAQKACAASGKSLCTNAQWQMAVFGTPDPYKDNPGADISPCNVWPGTRPLEGVWAVDNETTLTGSASTCISAFGANDMIGNVGEWVAEWLVGGMPWMTQNEGGPGVGGGAHWTETEFRFDGTWNVNGAASTDTGEFFNGLPAGVLRGGSFGNMASAGAYAFMLYCAPSHADSALGGRCCLNR